MIVQVTNHTTATPGRCYGVLTIEDDHFRIINDKGEPVLIERDKVHVVSAERGPGWIQRREDDSYYHGPEDFLIPGFFEDLFDGVEKPARGFETATNFELVEFYLSLTQDSEALTRFRNWKIELRNSTWIG